ncbi:phosphotransferase [Candidatus Woesebacteria bacterium]|nr:phosphotransferase [Candidatus Woesebacteria bacterium]
MNKNIIPKLEKSYDIAVKDLSFLRESPDNSVFVLLAEDGHKYVVRISKRNVLDDILFELSFMDFLALNKVPVPKILKTKVGNLFGSIDRFAIVIFEYIDGYHIEISPDKKPDLKLVAQAAQTLAKIHNISASFKTTINRKRSIFTEIERALEKEKILTEKSEGGGRFIKEIEIYSDWAKKNYKDEVIIQNDYRTGNIFFQSKRLKAIVDFDWICKGPAIKDLAHSLAEWSHPDGAKEYWKDVFDVFLENYNKLAKSEFRLDNNLYKWICFSCLSDAANYFVDLADERVYKKIAGSYMYQKYLFFRRLDNESLFL